MNTKGARKTKLTMKAAKAILSTISMVVYDSEDIDFKTMCFAEVGTSRPDEFAKVLQAKLNFSNKD